MRLVSGFCFRARRAAAPCAAEPSAPPSSALDMVESLQSGCDALAAASALERSCCQRLDVLIWRMPEGPLLDANAPPQEGSSR